MGETVLSNAEKPGGIQPGVVQTGQTPPDPVPPVGAVVIPENWKDVLPEELKGEESLKLVGSVQDLAKGYVHAQKAIGSDKIVIPSKHATEEDWKAVFNKFGLPESIDKYELNVDKSTLNEDFVNEFKAKAFESNVLPHQAQKMMDWYVEKSGQMVGEKEKSDQKSVDAAVADLQAEFGNAYNVKLKVASNTLKEVGGEELAELINSSPIANDVNFIRFLIKAGDFLKDEPVKGQAIHGLAAMSPDEAKAEMKKLRIDDSFLGKQHPNHADAIAEMNRLAQVAWPE